MPLVTIIQGGMGVGVSNWRLAQAVSSTGQLGVVSGTALDQIFARRLQDGDPGGDMCRAVEHFPLADIGQRVVDRYLVPGGRSAAASYVSLPLWSLNPPRDLLELTVVANFAEVWLAKQGHGNPVGINYLEKIQWPHLASIFGAMLAGVDVVLMGAGIPLKVPGVLDALARHDAVQYPVHVAGAASGDHYAMTFDPRAFAGVDLPALKRPAFLAIVASNTLATTMLKRANGVVDGFIVEGPTAGGHNAPPRGKAVFDDGGQPVYGDRDRVDLDALGALGVPFWLAGGYGTAEGVAAALASGATGVQVGTAFAYSSESGLRDDLKEMVASVVREGGAAVRTDPLASPTGFPFKVVRLAGSVSETEVYEGRPRICDLGYLRESFRMDDGTVGYRCAAEPVNVYTSKGGRLEDTAGRKCICNALISAGGFPQIRAGRLIEPPVVTSGDGLRDIEGLLGGQARYAAAEVVASLTRGLPND